MTNDDAINLHDTMDARVWAQEFCRIVGEKIPGVRDHEEWISTWFANAIMKGYDHANRRSNDERQRLMEAIRFVAAWAASVHNHWYTYGDVNIRRDLLAMLGKVNPPREELAAIRWAIEHSTGDRCYE